MNCFLKPIGRLMIKVRNEYLIATRNIQPGGFFDYFGAGYGEHNKKLYLIFGHNDKPIIVYENEVVLI